MAKNWRLKLIRPDKSIRLAIDKAWPIALKDLEKWMQDHLVKAMVFGGLGVQGIAETSFYKFIISPDGLSQLGIEATEPPKLLRAYQNTVKIIRKNKSINIKFGNLALLKLATPHPASGTGNLQIDSWLEWVFDNKIVQSGFVPRAKLPIAAQKSIRVKSSPGGLMLSRGDLGSTGLWRFPTQFSNSDTKWLRDNIFTIEKLIQERIVVSLQKSFK